MRLQTRLGMLNFQTLFSLKPNPFFQNNMPVQLFVEGIEDRYANEINDTNFVIDFFRPKYRDVVINEIMADPEPTVGLPAMEYVEIANATQNILELSGWKLIADEDTFALDNFSLPPNVEQLIVSTAHQGEFDNIQPLRNHCR